MGWLQALAAEFAITLADGAVWLSIGQGLLVGAICLLFGVWVARFVGLLPSDALAGETLGVGLASGLLVSASWWAAIASGGRSSFTPVAVGFAIAIMLAVVRRRSGAGADGPASASTTGAVPTATPDIRAEEAPATQSTRRRNLIAAVLGGVVFIVAVALLYGSTIVLSARNGVQPLEFQDDAYYSVLGADLAMTRTESIYSPSGFAAIDGLPVQTWYHWGELWLASAAITIFGMAPLLARHFVVLPVLLLACAALTGTIVRRMTGSASRGAYLFGFLACLFLARGPFFGLWACGLVVGITLYGLAAVAVLLAMYGLAVLGRRQATWALACFVGSTAALIVPAHVVIAVLALVGVGSVWTVRSARSLLATRRLPVVAPTWRRTFVVIGIAVAATVVWGVLTGHGVGGSGLSPSVSPFNALWRESVAITALAGVAFPAIIVAWIMVRKEPSIEADLYLGTVVLLVTGGLLWGTLLGDFNAFHLFFAEITVFATPVAAVAVWSIWLRLRAAGHPRLAIALLVLVGMELEIGIALSITPSIELRIATGTGAWPPTGPEPWSRGPTGARRTRLYVSPIRGNRLLGCATARP